MSTPATGRRDPTDPDGGTTRVSPGSWVQPRTGGVMMTWRSTWDSWRARSRRLRGPATVWEQTGRDRWLWIAVDAGALLVLLAIATLGFWLTYRIGWVWVAAMGGAALGVGIGVLAALRRWSTWLVAVLLVAAYLVFGSVLAMPAQAIGGVLPSPATLRALVLGVVEAWKQSLTIEVPIGEVGALLVVPLITMMLAGVAGISIALRSGRPGLAWLPAAGAVLVGIAFGLQDAFLPVLLGAGFVLAALLWNAYRRDYQRQTLLGKRRRYSLRLVGSAVAVLAVATAVAAVSAPVVAPTGPRLVLRDAVVPPVDVRAWPSPLQSFRSNLADHRNDVLFRVDGLPAGSPVPVRLATLDAYDGITFNVTTADAEAPGGGSFRRVGNRIPDRTTGRPVTATVTVADYTGRWVPTVGQTTRLRFTGERSLELSENFFYNIATGTGLAVEPLRSGDSYELEAVVPDQPARERVEGAQAADVGLPPAEPIADEIKEQARQWTAGAQSDGEAAIRLETELRRGYYSNGLADDFVSLAGHSSYRMSRLMTDNEGVMVGDEEQYAVAMALMARELGMSSRVVYGYLPTVDSGGAVTGDDVTAWVEIAFEDLGWVEFQPAPEKTRAPEIDTNPAESKPRPQVENPPPPPERPENIPPDNTPPREGEEEPEPPPVVDWALLRLLGLAVGIPLVLLGAPVITVLAWKARRRSHRMTRGSPTDRIGGGWDELIDRGRDLGARPAAARTRSENAAVLADRFADLGATPAAAVLAHDADRSSFGAVPAGDPAAHQYWREVDAAHASMKTSVSWWRRVRGALSLASLRTLR